MSTFYLDYENGNDSNSGASWALAWKTITSGATAARIAPGDVIRIAKSPDSTSLGQSATWTNLSKTVTLTTAVTANISTCESTFTAGLNTTASTDSTVFKQGSYSCKIVTATVSASQLLAYQALSSTDFSSYEQVSFWIRNEGSALTAGLLEIRLCSDTIGEVTVDTIDVPAIASYGRWVAVTVDNAAALGSAIQSVAIYCTAVFSSRTVYFDNIIACKASDQDDSLTLNSLISKNSAVQGGSAGWYALQSINGTTLLIDTDTNALATQGKGYYGTTETVATYKRETIKTNMAALVSTIVQQVQESGSSASFTEFQGGYNTSTSLQDGETFFDGQNGFGTGLYIGVAYCKFNYLNFYKYNYGVYMYGTGCNQNVITNFSNCCHCFLFRLFLT